MRLRIFYFVLTLACAIAAVSLFLGIENLIGAVERGGSFAPIRPVLQFVWLLIKLAASITLGYIFFKKFLSLRSP